MKGHFSMASKPCSFFEEDERAMNVSWPLTVIVGASPKKDRYSYLAMRTLQENRMPFLLVNPLYQQIEEHVVYGSLGEIAREIDTITLYLSPHHQEALIPSLLEKHPRRVIFNPGTECQESLKQLEVAGIKCLEACTLVLLKTHQYF